MVGEEDFQISTDDGLGIETIEMCKLYSPNSLLKNISRVFHNALTLYKHIISHYQDYNFNNASVPVP